MKSWQAWLLLLALSALAWFMSNSLVNSIRKEAQEEAQKSLDYYQTLQECEYTIEHMEK